jgi:hypothetical protein
MRASELSEGSRKGYGYTAAAPALPQSVSSAPVAAIRRPSDDDI